MGSVPAFSDLIADDHLNKSSHSKQCIMGKTQCLLLLVPVQYHWSMLYIADQKNLGVY